MNRSAKNWMHLCQVLSVIAIVVGYFLWTILIPIQDFDTIGSEELLRVQKELALNYPLGRFLLYVGFFGFVSSTIYLIIVKIKVRINKRKRVPFK
ncbi:hypothetical protein [Jeotgalibaca ciconiae]|nr:hypothetical protein [Jeotgalibaca ciconiae]